MSQKILLVDGHSIANRAFFGLPPMSYNGIPTGAILGFFNILFRTIDDEKPDQLAIAFDLNKPTFRHKMFEDYKGTRSPMLPELREQIPRIRKMLEEAGCAIVTKEGYEADDVLGTLAKKHGADGDSVVILSGDRDLLQLVDDQVTVRLPKTKKNGSEVEIYRPEDVQEAYGVTPDGFLQMKALMGDASDNIPGIPGVGEKTAIKLIQQFGSLDNLINNLDQVESAKLRERIEEGSASALMSKRLATIVKTVPVDYTIEDLNGQEMASKTFTPTVNIGGDTSNSFSGGRGQTFDFDIPETGEYVFTVYTDAVKNADFVLGMSTIQSKSFVTTGIKEINTNSEKVQSKKSGCYDLSGRKVSESNTTNGLKPGIYIINGRKTVIR